MARKVCPVTLFSAYCSSYSSVREMVSGTLLQLGAKALPPGQKEHEGMCVHSHLSLGLACHPCSMWAAQEVGKRAMPRSNARAGREPKQRWDPSSPPHLINAGPYSLAENRSARADTEITSWGKAECTCLSHSSDLAKV